MKFPSKRELQEIGFNYSSDIDFQDLMNIYKKFTAKPYLFLVIDATLASDSSFSFQKESFRKNIKLSALSSRKIGKYEYLRGEEMLPSGLSQITQQARFTYSRLGKAFEKQTEKQVGALKSLNLPNNIELKQIESISQKKQLNDLIINKLKEIMHLQNNIKLDDVEYTVKREKDYNFSRNSLPIVF